MAVVGTAGHVDHGKSTLVRALTGRDPDRWEEERARGLTIDLGFAWTTLPDGTEVSFVDVPGHERFMKNMLAGIEAIDVALLVVDADEGWKPQTEEHVAVLDLLGVERGVVVLTKVDRVDPDTVALARLEIDERLAGTSLATAPVLPVSAVTGEGLDELRGILGVLVADLPPAPQGRPRLWVDRSFAVTGAGTVVTGTLLDGALAKGDRLTLFPGLSDVRVRGLQTHERSADVVEPRRRVAVNLAGIPTAAAPRGSMLGRAGQWRPTDRFLARVRAARYVDKLPARGAYHAHVGSGAWPVRLRLLDDGAAAVVELPTPLPLRVGDRFILRETGRRLVVGGGEVLDPAPPRAGLAGIARALAPIASLDPDGQADLLLSVRGRADVAALAAETGGGAPRAAALVAGGVAYTAEARDRLRVAAAAAVDAHHDRYPLRQGIPTAELAEVVGLSPPALEALLAGTDIVVDRDVARRAGRVSTPYDDGIWASARKALAENAGAGDVAELGLDEELVHELARRGELVRVSPRLVFLPETVEELLGALPSLPATFTVAEFKQATGLTRKFAVPFLEWADRQGHTVRAGNVRRLRR